MYDSFGVEQTCVSRIGADRYFQCNLKRLPKLELNNQPTFYRIIFHELLFQDGMEMPISKEIPSDFKISSRLRLSLRTYQEWEPGGKNSETFKDSGMLCTDKPWSSQYSGNQNVLFWEPSGDFALVHVHIPKGQRLFSGQIQIREGKNHPPLGWRTGRIFAGLGKVEATVLFREKSNETDTKKSDLLLSAGSSEVGKTLFNFLIPSQLSSTPVQRPDGKINSILGILTLSSNRTTQTAMQCMPMPYLLNEFLDDIRRAVTKYPENTDFRFDFRVRDNERIPKRSERLIKIR